MQISNFPNSLSAPFSRSLSSRAAKYLTVRLVYLGTSFFEQFVEPRSENLKIYVAYLVFQLELDLSNSISFQAGCEAAQRKLTLFLVYLRISHFQRSFEPRSEKLGSESLISLKIPHFSRSLSAAQ